VRSRTDRPGPSSPSGRRALPTRRRLAAAALGLVAATGGIASSSAFWGATSVSGGSGAASAATVNQGATPSATAASGRLVSVSWGASTLSNGHAVDGYVVRRYDTSGGAAQTPSGGCSGTVAATSCTEPDVPTGQWQYTVTPVLATNWQGLESPRSGTVTLAAATLTLGQTLFGGALPQITTGSLTGFAANEAVTYRLDSGTTLSGAPSVVSATGTATITALTIPGAGDGPHTVYAVGSASPNPTTASIAIVIDTTPPTVAAQLSPPANAAGWNTAPVSVTLSASDATGSGVSQIRYTTDGSNPVSSATAVLYTAPIALAATTPVNFYATDAAGNASLPVTQQVRIDSSPPANAITLSSVTGAALLSGGTIYYRGSAGGSLSLTNAASDTGGSGPGSSATAALTGATSGWTHNPSLVSAPTGGPFVSNPFTWAAGTSSAPSESVIGSDVAGNTATTGLSFVNDSSGPTGGSVAAAGLVGTGARYSGSLGLHVTLAQGSDSGSGLAGTGAQLLRAVATLTSSTGIADGVCGGFGTYAQIGANDPASPVSDTVPTDGECYSYQYTVPDKLGNLGVYTSPGIKVQTTAPGSLTPSVATITPLTGTGAQLVVGSTVNYNPAATGSFTVGSAAADASSGVTQVAFPAVSGFAGGGAASSPSSGTTFATTYSWSANGASPSPGSRSLTATDNAGLTATRTSAFSIVADTVGPSGGSIDATGLVGTGSRWSTSLTLNLALSKGSSSLGLGASGAQVLRASAPLNTDGSGTCGAYGSYATIAGGSDPASPLHDTVTVDDTCYRYEYIVPDGLGVTTTYTSPDVKVDTAPPPSTPTFTFSGLGASTYWSGTGATVFYNPTVASGSFTVTAHSTDADAGIASYAFPTFPSGWSSAAGTLGLETYAWTAISPAVPSGSQSVTATSNSAHSASGSFTVTADSTGPAGGGVVPPSGLQVGSVSVSFTQGADPGGAGVNAASGVLQRASAPWAVVACGTFGSFTTIATNPSSPYSDPGVGVSECYKYRYIVSDDVGNQTTYTSTTVAWILL
jgi:chitobiase/beta-hexosaminidase-like protein